MHTEPLAYVRSECYGKSTRAREKVIMFNKKPSAVRWILGIWAVLAVGLPVLLIGLASVGGAPSGEVATWGLVGLLIGGGTGWLAGLVIWAVVNGIYGWKALGKVVADAYREGRAEGDALATQMMQDEINGVATPGPLGALPEGVPPGPDDVNPWLETGPDGQPRNYNPWGCCRNNYDPDGYPVHGGPYCRHPQASEQRPSNEPFYG